MVTLFSLPLPDLPTLPVLLRRRASKHAEGMCLTCSSWALVTSWGAPSGDLSWHPDHPANEGAVCVHACVCVRELIFRRVDKESGALEEKGAQSPREGERGLGFPRRKGQLLHCFVLVSITVYLA